MTVTDISPRASRPATSTEPLKVVPKPRESAPMNSTLFAHVRGDTEISAVRRRTDGPLELSIGSPSGGAQVAVFLHDDADVIRLIEALQSVYAS